MFIRNTVCPAKTLSQRYQVELLKNQGRFIICIPGYDPPERLSEPFMSSFVKDFSIHCDSSLSRYRRSRK